MSFEEKLNDNVYQVMLFSCSASLPFSFAKHTWLIINKKGIHSRFEVLWKLNHVNQNFGYLHVSRYSLFQAIPKYFFSEKIFWDNVNFHGIVEGGENSVAHKLVSFIEQSPSLYPFLKSYSLQGPNSNTYTAWILKAFPESGLRLPSNAFGKDYKKL